MNFSIQPFVQDDNHYLTCIDIATACWPEYPPSSLEQWRYRDDSADPTKFRVRFLLYLDNQTIGFGDVQDPYWLNVQGRMQYSHTLLPKHEELVADQKPVHSLVEEHVLSLVADKGIEVLLTSAREDKATRVAWLTSQGYAPVMRYPSSTLETESFDFSVWKGRVEQVEASGIEFFTLEHLQQNDPDWHPKLHEAMVEIELDVPSPNEPRPLPIDEFDKMLKSPSICPATNLIAVDNSENAKGDSQFGPYAAMTIVNPALSDPSVWEIWLTGVRRDWRRKGIATAIKLKSIAQARAQGGRKFETGNEENNPMFDINLKLGFTPSPAWCDYERRLDSTP